MHRENNSVFFWLILLMGGAVFFFIFRHLKKIHHPDTETSGNNENDAAVQCCLLANLQEKLCNIEEKLYTCHTQKTCAAISIPVNLREGEVVAVGSDLYDIFLDIPMPSLLQCEGFVFDACCTPTVNAPVFPCKFSVPEPDIDVHPDSFCIQLKGLPLFFVGDSISSSDTDIFPDRLPPSIFWGPRSASILTKAISSCKRKVMYINFEITGFWDNDITNNVT